jgi:beta-N-acetylglucosaminidase
MISDRRTILIEYRGDNPKLVSGHIYNRHDIAKAFGISRSTVATKLKGKTIMVDDDLILLKPQQSHKTFEEKRMTYMGKNINGFENGKKYTYKEISQRTGLGANALNKRIGKSLVFNEHHARPKSNKEPIISNKEFSIQFENYPHMVSAKWLRRKF